MLSLGYLSGHGQAMGGETKWEIELLGERKTVVTSQIAAIAHVTREGEERDGYPRAYCRGREGNQTKEREKEKKKQGEGGSARERKHAEGESAKQWTRGRRKESLKAHSVKPIGKTPATGM